MRPIAAIALGGLVTLLIAGTASARPTMWYEVVVEDNEIGVSEQAAGSTVATHLRSAGFEPLVVLSVDQSLEAPILCMVEITPIVLPTGQRVSYIEVSFRRYLYGDSAGESRPWLPGWHTINSVGSMVSWGPGHHDYLRNALIGVLEGSLQGLLPTLRKTGIYPALNDLVKEMGGLP